MQEGAALLTPSRRPVRTSSTRTGDAACARHNAVVFRRLVRQRAFVAFVTLAAVLEAVVLLSRPPRDIAPFLLVLVPPLAALLTSAIRGGRDDVLSLIITRWRLLPRWYAAALGVPLAGTLATVALAVLAGAASRPFSGLSPAAAIVPLVALLPALPEEFGWRGFGLPGRAGRWPPCPGRRPGRWCRLHDRPPAALPARPALRWTAPLAPSGRQRCLARLGNCADSSRAGPLHLLSSPCPPGHPDRHAQVRRMLAPAQSPLPGGSTCLRQRAATPVQHLTLRLLP